MSRFTSTKDGRRIRADAEVKLDNKSKIKIRFWIEKDNETFLASGRVTLLERIDKYKSISKAAKSMNISYRHAWELINTMNRLSNKPILETSIGGKRGGGAKLTEEGRKLIENFYKIKEKLQHILKKENF